VTDERYFSKSFIVCLIVSTAIIFTILIFGSYRGFQVTPQQANQSSTEVGQMRGTATWYGIFLNNFEIAVITFVPIIGFVWMSFVQLNTGYILGNLAKAYGVDYILIISNIVTSPTGLLEYSAYILSLAESIVLVYSAYNRILKERVKQHTWKTLLIVTGLLFVGAVVETLTIGRL
jgi:hypothetical protein